MSKLIYIPAFFLTMIVVLCGAMFITCVTILHLVSYAFGRLFLCPFGKHVTGWEYKCIHVYGGVEDLYRHEVHCAFCDHIEIKVC